MKLWNVIQKFIRQRIITSKKRVYIEQKILGNCMELLVDEIKNRTAPDFDLLDVGCGSGYYSISLVDRLKIKNSYCVDISEKSLNKLKSSLNNIRKKTVFHIYQSKIEHLPLPNNCIDAAMCNALLHEFEDPEEIIMEMSRVVKDKGIIVVIDFGETLLGRHFGRGYSKNAHGAYSAEELKRVFLNCNLKDIKITVIKHWVIGIGQK